MSTMTTYEYIEYGGWGVLTIGTGARTTLFVDSLCEIQARILALDA